MDVLGYDVDATTVNLVCLDYLWNRLITHRVALSHIHKLKY